MPEPARVDVVGVGLNATDTLLLLDAYPARGAKLKYARQTVLLGGQTASAMIACQTWGLRTRYVGKLGDDEAAHLHRRAFAEAGVEARITTVAGARSPQSLILVDAGGERTVLNLREEALLLGPADLDRAAIVSARALHVDGLETAAATQAARWAREAGIPVIADIDEMYDGVEELLALTDHLIVSRDFPAAVTGQAALEPALQRMHARYGCAVAGATLGCDGVVAFDGERMYTCPAYRVPVADTTGAGDIFHAGYIFGLLQGWPLARRLEFACAAAALNCTAMGARGGIAAVAAIEALIASQLDR